MLAWESGCSVTSPSVLGKGKACSSSSCTGELWVNKACGAKLTPESCLNKASSNSRLTAVGRQATAADSHSHNRLQTFFFLFSLPTFDETTTKLCLHAEKLTETILHLNLGHLVGFFLFCAVLFYFTPLMRQLQNNIWGTISRIGGWGTNTKIIIAFELGDFLYVFIYLFIYFFIFNPLSVSLMPFQLMAD
jgi:hypothetical protein